MKDLFKETIKFEWLTSKRMVFILICVGYIVFFNSLFGSFFGDDFGQIIKNQTVQSPSGIFKSFLGGSFNIGSENLGIYYKPLLTVAYTIIYTIFGPTAFFFHFFQLSIHIASSILLYLITKKFCNNILAFLAALIFLIHPINVEAVVYIADLQDVLYVFFGLLAFYLLLVKNGKQNSYWSVYFLLFCSLLSKESGILFLIITTIYVAFFKRSNLARHLFFLFLIVCGYLFLRIGIANIHFRESPITPIVKAALPTRMINIPSISVYYLSNFVYPSVLIVSQSWVIKSVTTENFFFPIVEIVFVFLLIIFSAFWVSKKNKDQLKAYLFFIAWFIIGMLAHIQIFPLDVTAADRYFYFPIIGLLCALAVLASNVKIKSNHWRVVVSIILVIILISLSLRTIQRNANWKNGLTLMQHDIEYLKDDYLINSSYGSELMSAGKNDQAFNYVNRAVQIYPDNWTAWHNLGILYYKKKDLINAEKAFKKSIQNGRYLGAYENLSLMLLKYGSATEAAKIVDSARKYHPSSMKLLYAQLLGRYKMGDLNGALLSAQELLQRAPNQETYTIYQQLQQGQEINTDISF